MNKMTEENFKLWNGRFLRTHTKCDDYIAILIFGYFSSLNFFIDWKLTFFTHFYAFFEEDSAIFAHERKFLDCDFNFAL